jgi:hypothetical protein
MSTEEQKKTPIFSDDFKLKVSKFTTNAYADYEGLFIYSFIALCIMTSLLFFWWQVIGQIGGAAYVHFWTETYPDTPLSLSYGYHVLTTLDLLTTFAFWIIWGFFLILLAVIIIKRSNKVKPVVEQPSLPVVRGVPNRGVPKAYSGQGCIYCSSKKVREGGKDNPNKMYCKSCRRFF